MSTKTKIFLSGLLITLLYAQKGLPQTVVIDPSIEYQKITGWGVSLAWWANIAGGWQSQFQDSLTRKATRDLNLNVFRFNIGAGENPSCPHGDHIRKDGGKMPGYRLQQENQKGWGIFNLESDSRQIAIMDKLASQRNDCLTECFSTSPPWWMTKSKCVAGNTDGSDNLHPDFIDDFADYLATVTSALHKRNQNWHIGYIEPFNEPLSNFWKAAGNQEGCAMHPDIQAKVIIELQNRLKLYTIEQIKMTLPDCNTIKETQWNTWYLWTNHKGAFDKIAKINTHSYFGTWEEKASLYTDAKNSGTALWQSETGPLNWTPSDNKSWWQRHYAIAYRMIEDLRNLKCDVWCDWQLLSTDEGWGLLQQQNFDTLNPYKAPVLKETRGFFCRKQVTSFVKQGYQIIHSSDGNTLAAIDRAKNELIVIITNQSGVSDDYKIDLNKSDDIVAFKTYRTSGDYSSQENCTEITANLSSGKGVLSGKTISYSAPPFSVTTFVITLKKDPLKIHTVTNLQTNNTFHTNLQFTKRQNLQSRDSRIVRLDGRSIIPVYLLNQSEIIRKQGAGIVITRTP